MKKHFGFLIASFLLMSSLSSAQDSCPEGFRYAGTLSGSDSDQFDKTVALRLPEYATLDESYQQTEIRATSSARKTASSLRPQDIPKGFYITPYGSREAEKVWVVSEPRLVKPESNGASSRYVFAMHLFCAVHASSFSQIEGPCEVSAQVCYKPKSRN
jgi:hypothetical protein